MLWRASAMSPISGVRTAPPTIAITSNDPPSLVLGPKPFSPRAKIVGNISDMKKLVANSAYKPPQPGCNVANAIKKTFTTA